jgi:hypothetical protein
MTSHEAQRVLFLHWPGFMPEARKENAVDAQQYLVRLVTWPPARTQDPNQRGELQARSVESFEAALRDLASFTPPLIRCQEQSCVLCKHA